MSAQPDRVDRLLSITKMITTEEARRIIQKAKPDIVRVLIKAGLYSGLRVSELLHIRKADVYVDRGIMVVWRRKKKKYAAAPLEMPKDVLLEMVRLSGKGPWVFPGGSGPCYRQWIERVAGSDGRIARTARREAICTGGHMTCRMAQRYWDRVLRSCRLKLPGRGPHAMRHFHATRWYDKTRDLVSTQQRLGHTSATSTAVYLHAVQAIEGLKKFGSLEED